jgi:hypothetical protein
MTANRGRDDELVDLEPEWRRKRTRDGEMATRRDRRAAGDAPEQRLVDLSGRTQRSGVAVLEMERRLRPRCDVREERNGD